MDAGDAKTIAMSAAVVVAGVLLWKARGLPAAAAGVAAGLVSGDNSLTRSQTNAAGEPTTAYTGVPVLGTLGAVANSAFGGWFATAGEAVGGWVYGMTHSDPLTTPAQKASYDETDRLLKRFPADPQPVDQYDPLGTYLGTW